MLKPDSTRTRCRLTIKCMERISRAWYNETRCARVVGYMRLKCLLIQEYRASEGWGDVGGSYTVGGPISCPHSSRPIDYLRGSSQRNAWGLTIRETDRERDG